MGHVAQAHAGRRRRGHGAVGALTVVAHFQHQLAPAGAQVHVDFGGGSGVAGGVGHGFLKNQKQVLARAGGQRGALAEAGVAEGGHEAGGGGGLVEVLAHAVQERGHRVGPRVDAPHHVAHGLQGGPAVVEQAVEDPAGIEPGGGWPCGGIGNVVVAQHFGQQVYPREQGPHFVVQVGGQLGPAVGLGQHPAQPQPVGGIAGG